ncbi:hypothetical protein TNCV_4958391 [Trichonephila clavipes]|nr:hypothetical protein TNCV_4958391 [Trichonephila clavipes]
MVSSALFPPDQVSGLVFVAGPLIKRFLRFHPKNRPERHTDFSSRCLKVFAFLRAERARKRSSSFGLETDSQSR